MSAAAQDKLEKFVVLSLAQWEELAASGNIEPNAIYMTAADDMGGRNILNPRAELMPRQPNVQFAGPGMAVEDDPLNRVTKVFFGGATVDVGEANMVLLDHEPGQEAINALNPGTLVVIYDPGDPFGEFGRSAFDIARHVTGFTGTEEEWLASLNGDSAFQIARDNGFSGTQARFNESLANVGLVEDVLRLIVN